MYLKTKGGDQLALRPEFTAGVMRAYIEHGMQSETQPIMLYSSGPVFRHDKPQKADTDNYTNLILKLLVLKKYCGCISHKTIAVI